MSTEENMGTEESELIAAFFEFPRLCPDLLRWAGYFPETFRVLVIVSTQPGVELGRWTFPLSIEDDESMSELMSACRMDLGAVPHGWAYTAHRLSVVLSLPPGHGQVEATYERGAGWTWGPFPDGLEWRP